MGKDQSHFIFEINVVNRRTQNRLTVKIQGRSMSDPLLSDIDLRIKWFGCELPLIVYQHDQ